jgi:16S rRNA (cytosine1402-N4)-methyltransferase
MTKAETVNTIHQTVLLNETIEGLNLNDKSVVVDATFGGGGHTREICKRYKGVKIIALDQDSNTTKNIPANCSITFHNTNFRNLDKVLQDEKVDGIIFDLGLSSDQLESSGRGFSFMKDEPLLMTMKENPTSLDITAREIVNTWEEKNLADIIYGYGEERFGRRIARGIAEARKKSKIETTFDLVKVIEESVPGFYKRGHAKGRASKIHCATKTFQAIRIAVNDELGALSMGLDKGFEALRAGGRISVISFHSLEDRIVKKFFKQMQKEGKAILIPARLNSRSGGNKKFITPSKEEIIKNNRARSAKLRVLEKTTATAGQAK